MIALIQTKNIMKTNNLKTKTKRAAALLLMLLMLAPIAAWAQNPDCNGTITITLDAPYTQGFEDGVIPDCWDVYPTTGYYAPSVNNSDPHSGSYSLNIGPTGYAVLPEFSNPLDELQISFWMRTAGVGSGQLRLGYLTAEDDGTCNTFTAIADYTSKSWVQYTNYLLNVPATAHRLAFKIVEGVFLSIDIDDVEVSVIPLGFCSPVGNLDLGRVASNSAYLSWELMDNNQTAWNVQVATDANFTENVANLEADSHENYLVEGLDPDTYYYVRVKPSCSDDLWSNTVQFWTMPPCNGQITVTADAPYTEGFENPEGTHENELGRLPACWESYTTGSVGPHNATPGSSLVHGGTQSLSFRSITSDDTYAILPEFSNPLNELQISFWLKCGYGRFQLGYLTSEDEGNCNTFTAIADFGPASTWTQHTAYLLNVPDTAHRLAFKWSESDLRCVIDDVEVSLNLALKPTDLACTEVTNTSATLTWTSNAESWQIMLNDDETNLIMADTNPFTLTGLVPETFYTAKVRSYWDSDNQSEWSDPVSFSTNGICPEGMVCIGNGTQTNNNLPTSNYYKYGLTQQIYTADEIGQAGSITSIEFFKASAYTMTRNLDIYLVCTDKDEFENTSDWIPVTANDLVFSGTVTFADQDWTTITLDEPFNYYGTSNVAVVVDDNTGGFSYSLPFHVFSTEKEQTILYCDSNNNYDPTASPGNAINTISEKNRIRLGMEELPGCERPTLLAVDTLGATSATLSWTENGEATAWQIMLNGEATNLIEATSNPFTLDSLITETTYTAKVRAHCPDGNGISLWSSPISFTTNPCENMCTLTFVVTDSYGDGWNGNAIQVKDVLTDNIIATIANQNLNGIFGLETQTIALNVCDGRELEFSWVSGSWVSEVSYTVTDLIGDVIVEGSGSGFDTFNYTVSCTVTDCRRPTAFAASEIGPRSVVLSWTENGSTTEWEIAYMSENDTVFNYVTATTNPYTLTGLAPETQYAAQVTPVCEVDKPSIEISWTTTEACPKPYDVDITPYPYTANVEWSGWGETYDIQWAEPAPTSSAWLRYDDGVVYSFSSEGTHNPSQLTWGVMYPADSLHDNLLTRIAFYEDDYYYTDSIITLNIYSGGDTNPETLIGTETITLNGTYGWREVFLSMPIEFNPAQNLWITLTATGRAEVMAMSSQDAGVNGRWFLNGSDWVDVGTLYQIASYTNCFAIRGFVETNDYSTWNWATESGVASPFTITGLEAETDYAVRVKSNCGQDCESGWTWAYFTTLSACDRPFGLEATNITCNSATLNWTGYQDSYNLKYRHRVDDPNTPATIILEAPDVWGNGSGYQMLLDADATALGTIIHPTTGYLTYNCNIPEGLYDAFEYMIPANADASCTAVNVVVNNSVTIQIPAGTYDWCITRPVAGDRIWIAGNRGNIKGRYDNYVFEPGVTYHFTMGLNLYGEGVTLEIIHNEWSDWTVVENITHPYSFTGLIPEAEYEWQVQGINADCGGGLTEWSEIATFTSLEGSIFTKEIVGYGESNDGYYLIASPVVEPIMPSEENGFLTNAFDLYRFNQNGAQALEWENWKAEENYHFPIENGRGYLYASQENTTLTFVGTPYSGNGQVTLTKTDGVTFEGWNLVGNPFPTMAFIADGRPFYTVNGDGSQIIGVVSHSIEVMEAIFVVAEEDGETMTFTTEMPALGASLSLNVMAAEPTDTPTHRAPTVVDRAIIRFDEGRQLPKFQLNGNSTKVYIPQGGMDYAVVCSEGKGELPLNFKAAKNGTYTLSVNMENMDFDYLHLIDNLTGADVDLLAVEPVETPTGGNGPSTSSGTSYTFTAKTTDYESRFKLVFSADEDVCEPNEAFAYINNGNIVITTDMGDATLQIVDVMGRVVASYGGHTRCVSTSGMTAGVYVLRLIDGENVRTQKIVVE